EGGQLRPDPATERGTDHGQRGEPERAEQIDVVQHVVEHSVDVLDTGRLGKTRMRRQVDREASRELIVRLEPLHVAAQAVQVEERGAAPADQEPHLPAVQRDGSPLGRHVPEAAAAGATGRSSSRRRWGITSAAKSSMFLRVRSAGRVASWSSVSTLPTPSQRTISSICSRTVAGLPTIAYPPATISSQLVTFSMKSPKAPTIFRAERAEV